MSHTLTPEDVGVNDKIDLASYPDDLDLDRLLKGDVQSGVQTLGYTEQSTYRGIRCSRLPRRRFNVR